MMTERTVETSILRLPTILLSALLATGGGPAYGADDAAEATKNGEPVAVSATRRSPRFDIWEIRVEGNTLLDRKLVERTVYPFLGPQKTVQDVEDARQALENFFRNSGFSTVIVDIPEQSVSTGIVRLSVIEGSVDRLRVTGSRYFLPSRIRAGVPELEPGNIPNIPRLQEQLKALNQANPDRSVTPVMRPGRTPGTVEVELKVKDAFPLHGDVELNDRYSRDTTKLRASANLRYANLWQRGHSASVLFSTAPREPDEVKVFAGTYVAPLRGQDVLAAYVVSSRSDVATAGDLTVLGDGTIVGARFVHPFPFDGGYFHSATLGLDYKDFSETVSPQGGPGDERNIDYLNFMVEYRGTVPGEKNKLGFGVSANFGVRGLGNGETEFAQKRVGGKPNYIYAGAFFDYSREVLSDSWLSLRIEGQRADSPLVSNEQYSAGGAESVRGYYESQVLADDAVLGGLEWSSPALYRSRLAEHGLDIRLLTFVEGAVLRLQQPLPGQDRYEDIESAGFGLRVDTKAGFDASFDWAWALATSRDVERGDARAHFRLHYGF